MSPKAPPLFDLTNPHCSCHVLYGILWLLSITPCLPHLQYTACVSEILSLCAIKKHSFLFVRNPYAAVLAVVRVNARDFALNTVVPGESTQVITCGAAMDASVEVNGCLGVAQSFLHIEYKIPKRFADTGSPLSWSCISHI